MAKPTTPKNLERAGYRIEYGVPENRGRACYWWTLTRDGMVGVEASEDEFDTAMAAEVDAYLDLERERWEQARAYFGLDPSFVYDQGARLQYVLDMLASEERIKKAFDLLRQVQSIIKQTDPAYADENDLPQLSGADVVQCLCELEVQIDKVLEEPQ